MSPDDRQPFGITTLDQYLGGGLRPGTLTVVAGTTGIGKTQLGLHFAHEGLRADGRRGVVFDMTSRGNSQNHAAYARNLFGWKLNPLAPEARIDGDSIWGQAPPAYDYVHIFDRAGRRVGRDELEFDQWQAWKGELARKLNRSIFFFYAAFVRGVRRAVIDGLEPVDRPSDSIQLELCDYIYHQILRKDADWVARDLLRERFHANREQVESHLYDPAGVGCVVLYTTREVMLEDLISRPLDQGDLLSGANTVILMGKVREGSRLGRALYVAKHRGSYAYDGVVPFAIRPSGIVVEPRG